MQLTWLIKNNVEITGAKLTRKNIRCFIFFLFRWPVISIHGDKTQQERDWALNGMLLMCSSTMFSAAIAEQKKTSLVLPRSCWFAVLSSYAVVFFLSMSSTCD